MILLNTRVEPINDNIVKTGSGRGFIYNSILKCDKH